jgi:hypothetical protein
MSNEKQQTAVEWLAKSYLDLLAKLNNEEISLKEFEIQYIELLKHAKGMEKEQIVNTWSEATTPQHEIGLSDASYVIAQIKKAEQYYNETYGGTK